MSSHEQSTKYKNGLWPLIALTMAAVNPPSFAGSDGIEVMREVLLENSIGVEPRSIHRAPDGGYVITGTAEHNRGWAAKTDADGNQLWTYEMPVEGKPRLTVNAPDFRAAVSLRDGGTLLCGYIAIGERPAPQSIAGIFVKLDNNGRFITRTLVYPGGDQSVHLNYLEKCAAWRDGFAVLGHTQRFRRTNAGNVRENHYWLFRLGANGVVVWEKLIPNSVGIAPDLSALVVLSNGDLAFSAWRFGVEHLTEIITITQDGEVRALRKFTEGLMLVRSILPDANVRAITFEQPDPNYPEPSVLTFPADLQTSKKTLGHILGNVPKQAYIQPDQSLILFGSDFEHGAFGASIVKLRADLRSRVASRFEPFNASYWIEDAVPSGNPGEFVTARYVLPTHGETRNGVVVTFVRIR